MAKKPTSPKGEDNLTWRNGVAYARIQINGFDRRISLRTRDRAEARRRLKIELERAEKERAGELSTITFRTAVISWAEAGFNVRSENTQRRYKQSLRMMRDTFEPLIMDEITRRKIGEYVGVRVGAGATHATVRRDLTALSGLLRHCVARGWRDDNPAREWDRSTIREFRDHIQRPCKKSYDACVKEAPPIWKSLLKFLLASGFRLDVDAASLLRANVNWKTGGVTFKTKGGRLRTRLLNAEALEILKDIPVSLESEFVFWAPGRPRLTNLSRAFEDIRARAVARAQREGWAFRSFRLHDLRHEFAIRYLEAGGSIYTLQGLLGHSSVMTTEGYLAFVTDEEAEAAKNAPSADLSQMPSHGQRFSAKNRSNPKGSH